MGIERVKEVHHTIVISLKSATPIVVEIIFYWGILITVDILKYCFFVIS